MNEMFYRQSALDCIANGLLKNYRNGMYLYGAPRSIPIEEIIEVEYKLTIEYVKLRKSGNVLGQTVFENCFVPVYDKENEQYTIIEVQPGTILIDEALLEEENMGRYRYTLTHELSHWILHHKILIIRRNPPPRQRQKAILKPNGRQTLLLLRYLCRKCR